MRQHILQSWFILPFLFLFVSCRISFSVGSGTDTLSAGQNISVTGTLTSQGRTFQLGFFNRGKTNKVYLGIWYVNLAGQMTVWVANRDKPLDYSPYNILKLSKDGNLVLLNPSSKTTIWTTNLESSTSNSTEAVLLDDGNFVLRNSLEPSIIYWQSFDNPTDTWLPGAKLGINKLTGKTQLLTSWKNSEDPAPGRFSFGIDPNGGNQNFLEWNMSRRYWSTGDWNGEVFASISSIFTFIFNISFVSNERESYFIYSLRDSSMLARLVISPSGQIEQPWEAGLSLWDSNYKWAQPSDQSEVFAFCGVYGIFNKTSSTNCMCLQGFKPNSIEETLLDDWSGGCVRNTPLKCQNNNSNGKNDGFLKISNLILPVNSKAYPAKNAKWCESACKKNCSCTAYAYNGSGCSIWEGALLNLQLSNGNKSKQDLYLKLTASELRGNREKLWVIIASLVTLAVLISGFFIWYLCRRKLRQNGVEYSNEDVLLYDFDGSYGATDHETNASSRGKKVVDLPFFSFASISAATGGFSSANKLGEGGFGPVYRGRLVRGQEIAVKRLSRRSGQGLEEFRNETVLIAKLQHRNLVRVLGYCIEQDEKILIYEYMPNKSLDFLLFEATNKQEMLDWRTRIHIIEGISQGLLYLHQYSRLRIIHRDLKASNVLLDGEMNPKISDFGMARIFGGNELQANTNRIVGTYGYMAPEYAMEGLFSIKSDVFSFGVLLLEILSGKRNTGFYRCNSLNLLGHAWDLWNADRGSDLLDPVVDCPSTLMLSRYINIGLLCVQENPTDRPTMSDVVTMLSNELAPLPRPKQPAFSTSRAMVVDANSSQNSEGTCSVNRVTISTLQGR